MITGNVRIFVVLIPDVVCNIMDLVLKKQSYNVYNLELSDNALHTADARFSSLVIPKWIDLTSQSHMITHPKSLKTHDWKQVSIIIVIVEKSTAIILYLFQYLLLHPQCPTYKSVILIELAHY